MEPGQGLGLTLSPSVGVPGDTGLREAFRTKGRSWCAKAPAGWECWGGCEESWDWGSPRRALGVGEVCTEAWGGLCLWMGWGRRRPSGCRQPLHG